MVKAEDVNHKKARNLNFTQDSLLFVLYATSASAFSITSICGCAFKTALFLQFPKSWIRNGVIVKEVNIEAVDIDKNSEGYGG